MKISKQQLRQLIQEEVEAMVVEEIETRPGPLLKTAIEELSRGAREYRWPVGGIISQLHMVLEMIQGSDQVPETDRNLGLADTQIMDTTQTSDLRIRGLKRDTY
jgi:hypothetical protein